VDNFLYNFVTTDPKYSDLAFDLDGFIAPVAPPCLPDHDYAVNESCSLGLFTLTQGSSGVDVRLEIFGSFEDPTFGDNGSPNIAIGRYTSQSPMLVNETGATVFTIRQVVDVIDAGQHINTSYSASFVATAVPEPATLLTFGLGTAALAVHRRRRAKKNQKV
jgi:hypothetical protein